MKRYLSLLLGMVVLLLAAACGNNSSPNEANGKEKSGEGSESEVNVEALIDQLSLDASIDTSSEHAKFNFSLKNTGEESVILGFNSSQKYEIKVVNEKGENVYTFSEGKAFTQQLTTVELPKGEELSVSESWVKNIEPGQYEATITFLVSSINDQPIEANPFEVTQSFTIPETDLTNSTEDGSTQLTELGNSFRQLNVEGKSGSYTVTGEARVFEGTFMYSVEDGHNVIIKPTSVQVSEGAPSWSEFKINVNIAEEDLPEYGNLTMVLYEKSAETGEPTNMSHLSLDRFDQ